MKESNKLLILDFISNFNIVYCVITGIVACILIIIYTPISVFFDVGHFHVLVHYEGDIPRILVFEYPISSWERARDIAMVGGIFGLLLGHLIYEILQIVRRLILGWRIF